MTTKKKTKKTREGNKATSTNFPDKDTKVMTDHKLKSALSYCCSKANIILGNKVS